MTPKKISAILSSVFLLLCSAFLILKSLERPRVLILHSYFTDFSWVTDINEGIQRELGNRPYNIRYYYMDTKRHSSPQFKKTAGIQARHMIDEWRPDVIIALDDNAQQYAAKYYVDDPEITILYAGVNATLSKYGYDKAMNVSGIAENIPWHASAEQLLKLIPKNSRLLHLSDASESSVNVHDSILAHDWSPFEFVDTRQIEDFDEWKETVREAEDIADCLLITHYHTIQDPDNPDRIITPSEIIKWTEANTSLPTVGFWGFFVEDGGMMAVGLSPFEQGEVPAQMAIEAIENDINPLEIRQRFPSRDNHLFVMYMRESSFRKRLGDKPVPSFLEAFSRALDGYFQ